MLTAGSRGHPSLLTGLTPVFAGAHRASGASLRSPRRRSPAPFSSPPFASFSPLPPPPPRNNVSLHHSYTFLLSPLLGSPTEAGDTLRPVPHPAASGSSRSPVRNKLLPIKSNTPINGRQDGGSPPLPVFRKELANLTQLPGEERKSHGIFAFPELLGGSSAGG